MISCRQLTTLSFPELNVGVRVFLKCFHSDPLTVVSALSMGLFFKSMFYILTKNDTDNAKLRSYITWLHKISCIRTKLEQFEETRVTIFGQT